MTKVFLDGELVDEIEDPSEVKEALIEKRRSGGLRSEIGVYYAEDKDELRISSDAGRVQRPVIIVRDGEPQMTEEQEQKLAEGEVTIEDLVEEGVLEFIDAEEEENAYVAMDEDEVTEEHTHMEIDPAITHGLSASLVVFPQNNRGDRVNFGAKMSGQGIGMYTREFHQRFDTNANVMHYAQQPITETQTYDTMLGEHPIGQNMVVALGTFEGYNIEDSVIMNQGSIDRGLERSTYLRTYKTEAQRFWGGQKDKIEQPDKDVRGYRNEEAYKHLDHDGLVNPETEVNSDDVLVGKTSPPKFLGSGGGEEVKMGLADRRETSLTVRHGEQGKIDKLMVSETGDGDKLIKIKLRENRIPELGDKFATRHGQKGVIGMIVPEENMPFTKQGVTPDMILSTHAIPSRMTVSQLIEIIAGKTGAMRGEKVDGTAFHSEDKDEIREELEELGFEYSGKETMYNGITGEEMEAEIMIGPGYYLKLDHQVGDKIHARGRGPVTLLTKQPTEGRSQEGGLRLGEMEKDVFVGHGASLLLKERFGADATQIHIDEDSGDIGYYDHQQNKVVKPSGEDGEFEEAEVPHAFLLLMNELKSMMMDTDLNLEEEN
ncbi:DNA-directed RNA polymerase subunit B [Candidatus Nanohalococcus occultus]|uniref:DNA-directed RNA polymerase subunit beta n=1 Tax=Candidatus Nanohalococcus occultus TaxID=2978047 RepID=A0ABY8CDE6_9ARCH|nr:DNA-directed RNA polymerase subunit B' [Candidatus Nanohaloarchaeota archaeon SVXNc]